MRLSRVSYYHFCVFLKQILGLDYSRWDRQYPWRCVDLAPPLEQAPAVKRRGASAFARSGRAGFLACAGRGEECAGDWANGKWQVIFAQRLGRHLGRREGII